jgi:hypothetical protein
MSDRFFAALTALTAVLFVLLLPGRGSGQAFYAPDTPKFPQARTWVAQKAKLPPYTAPRTPDGVPNIQGVWGGPVGGGNDDIEEHGYVDVTTPPQESYISDPPDGKVPYTPWALAKRNEIRAGLGRGWPAESGERLYADPTSFCLNGMPRISFGPQEIVQKPDSVIMLSGNDYRVIPTDGRPRLGSRVKSWLGSSRGRWDGDTLVVEVTGLNGRGWFDSAGNFYTENTRLVERWRLVNTNTIDYEVTIEDPTIYTRPWKINFPKRRAGTGPRGAPRGVSVTAALPPANNDPHANELWETACYEGNTESRDSIHSIGFKWFAGVTPPK